MYTINFDYESKEFLFPGNISLKKYSESITYPIFTQGN